MTKGIRYGLALLCVAALGGFLSALAAESIRSGGDDYLVRGLGHLTLVFAGAAGFLTLAVSLVRGSRRRD